MSDRTITWKLDVDDASAASKFHQNAEAAKKAAAQQLEHAKASIAASEDRLRFLEKEFQVVRTGKVGCAGGYFHDTGPVDRPRGKTEEVRQQFRRTNRTLGAEMGGKREPGGTGVQGEVRDKGTNFLDDRLAVRLTVNREAG